jgi:hypothetical protein
MFENVQVFDVCLDVRALETPHTAHRTPRRNCTSILYEVLYEVKRIVQEARKGDDDVIGTNTAI